MLDTRNYFEHTTAINWAVMPPALAKGHSLVQGASQENWKAYRDNENIRRVVNAYFEKLDSYLATIQPAPKQAPKTKQTKATTPRQTKAPKTTPKSAKTASPTRSAAKPKAKPNGTPVELIGTDVQFVRRYAAMHGKVKSQAQVLALIHALQKAILERRIRKESPYAKEIGQMQEQLIRLYEKMGEMAEIQIEAKNLKRYQEIGSSQTNMPSINLLKAYVRLNGKRGIQEKAQRLAQQMRKAVNTSRINKEDKYSKQLNQAYATLLEYAETNGDNSLHIHQAELNGLMGMLSGENSSKKKVLKKRTPQNLW